jgi:hypothetical protein
LAAQKPLSRRVSIASGVPSGAPRKEFEMPFMTPQYVGYKQGSAFLAQQDITWEDDYVKEGREMSKQHREEHAQQRYLEGWKKAFDEARMRDCEECGTSVLNIDLTRVDDKYICTQCLGDISPCLKGRGFSSSRTRVSCFNGSCPTSFRPNGSDTPSTGRRREPLGQNVDGGIGITVVNNATCRTCPFTHVQG